MKYTGQLSENLTFNTPKTQIIIEPIFRSINLDIISDMCSFVPVMVTFGHEDTSAPFKLCEVDRCETMSKLLGKFGSDDSALS